MFPIRWSVPVNPLQGDAPQASKSQDTRRLCLNHMYSSWHLPYRPYKPTHVPPNVWQPLITKISQLITPHSHAINSSLWYPITYIHGCQALHNVWCVEPWQTICTFLHDALMSHYGFFQVLYLSAHAERACAPERKKYDDPYQHLCTTPKVWSMSIASVRTTQKSAANALQFPSYTAVFAEFLS